MQEIKDLTLNEVMNVDKAIRRVRDKIQPDGMTIPGCTFPFKIMYKNGKIQGQIKNRIKAFNDAKKAKIEEFQIQKDTGQKDEKGKPIKAPWLSPENTKKIEEELEKEVVKIEKDLVLQPYKLSEFLKMEEDQYYKDANKDTPIPQEFFSLMGRMIYDDTEDKEKKPEKKK